MNRATVIAALLRLYPRAWRNEYGAELADMLLAAPLSARTIGDILWNGLRHRARATEPWVWTGLVAMLWLARQWPRVAVNPRQDEVYVLFLVACGYWTHHRHRTTLRDAGFKAGFACLLSGVPTLLAGILVALGLLPLARVTEETGFRAYLHFLTILWIGQAWLWGLVGAAISRAVLRRQARGSINR